MIENLDHENLKLQLVWRQVLIKMLEIFGLLIAWASQIEVQIKILFLKISPDLSLEELDIITDI